MRKGLALSLAGTLGLVLLLGGVAIEEAEACGPAGSTAPVNPGSGAAVAAQAARAAGFTGDDQVVAVAVAGAESGWQPTVTNANADGTTDHGTWQINSVHAELLAAGDWRDPADNARMAYGVWRRAGGSWTPWVTFDTGAYLEHVPAARAAVAALPEDAEVIDNKNDEANLTDCGAGLAGNAAAFTGAAPGCTIPDPTGTGGCVTPATAHMLAQVTAAAGGRPWPDGASCWDEHAWNPSSDHPKGRACDFTLGAIGRFPSDADRARGWGLARWLQDNAKALRVAYLIWDGRQWSVGDRSWRLYGGGGIYDPSDATGGHYDHVHVSLVE